MGRWNEKMNALAKDYYLYVFCKDRAAEDTLMEDLEAAGYTCGGKKPTVVGGAQLVAIWDDHTLCFPGMVGHIAFQSAQSVSGKKILRLDYAEYVASGKIVDPRTDNKSHKVTYSAIHS